MQMLGIGIPELLVILLLAVIVVGPDRLPQVAADLARWIRRTRAYAQHLMVDFNDVIGDLEKEVGASRDDWKEIASVVGMRTNEVTKELESVTSQVQRSLDLSEVKKDEPAKVVPIDAGRTVAEAGPETEADAAASETPAADDKAWYVPERPTRRRRNE